MINIDSNDHIGMALSDCAKLYDESEPRLLWLLFDENFTDHKVETWLSSILGNHKSCLDGLEEKNNSNFVEAHMVALNLITLLDQALVLYRNKGINNKGNSTSN